uniref:Uncharacterized protein n=1 Tax=Panstrongylus lignarius TaxID=156445 RepID=A0A224Y3P8_9HEMI
MRPLPIISFPMTSLRLLRGRPLFLLLDIALAPRAVLQHCDRLMNEDVAFLIRSISTFVLIVVLLLIPANYLLVLHF